MNRRYRSLTLMTLSTLLAGSALAGGGGAPVTSRPVSPVTTSAKSELAKLTPKALLAKAIAANGGQALRTVKTSFQTGDVNYYDAEGQVVGQLRTDMLADFVSGQSKQSLYNGDALASTFLLTKAGAFSYTPQSGTVPMPRQEAQSLKEAFYYGSTGLLKGEKPGSVVKNLGDQTWLNLGGKKLTGTVLEITTDGVKGTFMLSPQGELMAERYPIAPLGDTISVYSDRYVLSGLVVPKTTAVFTAQGALFMTMKESSLKFNAPLAPDAFKVPE